jgi:hypothetical protein
VAALPIMLELAEEPTVGCRAGIVELIGEVAKTGWRPVGTDEDWARRWAGAGGVGGRLSQIRLDTGEV